ncbi:MAG: formylglycine-generating enzyme family protein [Candidatus Delongbacteria bacterium]|nr:formylglycine-generating enzyme family protein [Candidatus Delongbacteria bacterium]
MKHALIVMGFLVIILIAFFYTEEPGIIIEDDNGVIDSAEVIKPQTQIHKKKPTRKKISMDMVLVDEGTFQMGCNSQNEDEEIDDFKAEARKSHDFESGNNNRDDEKPVHDVRISKFYIGKYEVTQKEWKSVMGKNPSHRKGNNNPVEKISWYDAVEFCNRLSAKDGLEKCYSGEGVTIQCDFTANGYRLPTEAEWEFAAKGGGLIGTRTDFEYSGSNEIDEVAWYRANSAVITHPVGSKKPNEIGIYDMSGNVWEWCWDWYDQEYYKNSPNSNPTGPDMSATRVIRGGSWGGGSVNCLVENRRGENPHFQNKFNGLRVARKF